MSSLKVKIKVPPAKKGLEPKQEEVLFREDDTAKTVIEYVIKQFGLNAEKG